MIKFLINRPISVLMAFLACCIVGMVTLPNLPVSLLPDIPIPEITIQVSGENTSARELENTVVRPLRQQLNQLGGLQDIRSETRDGNGLIRLRFEYGTNTDLAFVEVNEKIDAAMNYLPENTERPRVVKASATDIPVEYLNLTLRSDKGADADDEIRFLELSEYAQTVVKRRIEQLPEVSMVDVTGLMQKEVVIAPDNGKLEIAGITLSEIEQALSRNNVEPGSMVVRDGYYEYNIRFSTVVRTLDDVRNIFIRKNDRIYRLSDLADIHFAPATESGMALYKGKRCIRMAIIKQADVNMDDMQKALDGAVWSLKKSNPELEFHTSENQTELLDYTISNLKQNLLLAFLFVWLISVFFMNDVRSPLVIGLSMVVSVIVSLLLFYLLGLSVNVVSLTGLILASGNMIDNSIVVSDNITQYRRRGLTPDAACIKGTGEVMGPMLSSGLSSVAVFAPLVFLSGIAGALFFDQALSVTIGMLVSYVTGIVLLPVLYKLFSGLSANSFHRIGRWWRILHWKKHRFCRRHGFGASRKSRGSGVGRGGGGQAWLDTMYHRGIIWVFDHKRLTTVSMLLVLPLCAVLFYLIPKEKMPDLHQRELVVTIDWNENIHVGENLKRTRALLLFLDPMVEQQTGLVGEQQFLLDRTRQKTSSETEVYLKVANADELKTLEKKVSNYLVTMHPKALISFAPAGTIFEKIFTTGEADLLAECYPTNRERIPEPVEINGMIRDVKQKTGESPAGVSFQQQLNLHIDQEKLLYYNVSYNDVYQAVRTAFQVNRFATLRSFQQYLPVVLGDEQRTVQDILANTLIAVSKNTNGTINKLSLDRFVTTWVSEDLKTVVAGKAGEYVPLAFHQTARPEALMQATWQTLAKTGDWEVSFSGGFFSNRKMLGELMIILLISILLMYFILVAQFENFVQPLIILMEIPIDLAASLLLLMVLGHSLNLMSAIGMVVTCGIVINDSILKVDAMNQLRAEGYALMDAIHEAGRRRLNAILMTSLTSIVCMAPLLFTNDLGSNLEKPLALATIGGMIIGTPVSLFVVPLLYWRIYRKKDKEKVLPTPDNLLD
jgi:multidrug efflux pump subunit AcrB